MGLAGVAKRFFDRRTAISPEVLRKAIPVQNALVEVISDDGDGILLQHSLRDDGKGWPALLARIMKAPAMKKVELEQVGAFVWRLCDGKHTFEGISIKLREEYKMKRVEADAALGAFLQMLAERKLITLMVKGQK
jgi:hypothetical protein